jgi:uncharacterized lipoprotein
MNKLIPAIALGALAVTASGCKSLLHSKACLKPGAYVDARNEQPLKVPAGMDAPDTRGALKIPDVSQPAKVRTAADGCLDAPPKFEAPKASKPAA